MNLVILAAGYGTRLNGKSNIPKGLMIIKNISIMERNIKYITDFLNITKLIIVTNEKFVDSYKELLSKFIIEKKIIVNDFVERGNGYSFFLAKKGVNSDEFILIMSDHIYSRSFISLAILGRGLAVDSDPIYIDYEDATKVLVDSNGYIENIGKNLKYYNYIDTGFFILNKNIFYYSDKIEKEIKKFGVSDIIREAKINVIDVTKNVWIDIDTKNDLSIATKLFSVIDS